MSTLPPFQQLLPSWCQMFCSPFLWIPPVRRSGIMATGQPRIPTHFSQTCALERKSTDEVISPVRQVSFFHFLSPFLFVHSPGCHPPGCHTTDPGICRHTTDPGICRHTTDPGICRHTTDPGICRHTTDPGICRHTTDPGICRQPTCP